MRLAISDEGAGAILPAGSTIAVHVTGEHEGILDVAIEWEGTLIPVSLRPDQVPADEIDALKELVGLLGDEPAVLFRLAVSERSGVRRLVPSLDSTLAEKLPTEIGDELIAAMHLEGSRFPLRTLLDIGYPVPPERARVYYLLARYDADLAARGEVHHQVDLKGADFGWLDWERWTEGWLTARPWASMDDPERLLAISEYYERGRAKTARAMAPYFAIFDERVVRDAEALCSECGTVGTEFYQIPVESDPKLDLLDLGYVARQRLMCAACHQSLAGGVPLGRGRERTLKKLRAAWNRGELVSGSFSGDLHALSVIVGGKDDYYTLAERQAKELAVLLTLGEVLDLSAEKQVNDPGVDALFFANRGLFTGSLRNYIAIEVKTTGSIANLKYTQIKQAVGPARNLAARLLTTGDPDGRTTLDRQPPALKSELETPEATKRWYRYYVARGAFQQLTWRAEALEKQGGLPPELKRIHELLSVYFAPRMEADPEAYAAWTADPRAHAAWAAEALGEKVESVLFVRFTSLDGESDGEGDESEDETAVSFAASEAATEDLASALGLAGSYFDSFLFFDLFGRPLEGYVGTTLPGVDMGSTEALFRRVVGLLARLRVRVHAESYPAQYPRAAIARLEAEAG